MDEKQKFEVVRMRKRGESFSKISEITGISRNTIKSYCKRKNVLVEIAENKSNTLFCKQCGKKLQLVTGRKKPKFCSAQCRMQWWNSHLEEVNKKAIYNFTCIGCGKEFTAYGNKSRKYCSHNCYINTRFKVGDDNG